MVGFGGGSRRVSRRVGSDRLLLRTLWLRRSIPLVAMAVVMVGLRARLSALVRMRNLLGLCGLRRCMAQMGGGWRCKLDFDLLLPSVLFDSFTLLI